MKPNNLKILAIGTLALGLFACAHNPNKAEKVDTQIDKSQKVSGDTEVGVKDGNLVVQQKTMMAEELRDLQYEVYTIEDHVYGNAKFGSLGLYGVLKSCKLQLSDRRNGGDGKLMWTEPIDRVTDKEDDFKVGIDENNKIVGVTDEFLKDRLARFREYKKILRKRETEYQEKIDICQADLKSRKYDQEKARVEDLQKQQRDEKADKSRTPSDEGN